MANQTIQQVVDAEAKAKGIKADFEAKLEQLRHEYRAKLKALTEEKDAEVADFKANKKAELDQAYAEYQAQADEENQGQIQGLGQKFDENKEDLVAYVVEEVRKSYGNS
ncbi:hypothetical protein ACX3VT_02385 [Aerococcus sanguinicola]|uniref:Uncharacterized protein n=1 Tax=Aerococcus sanguinicola TaxID=119206 RepID=A0A0X8FCS7_9LACT|nr:MULTISPECIES: hypothetical protein [Aerococcus]AMB94147.1 hypothetical protein AWM72_04955 [Aerococcus sanguinicola]KAB0647303.1 hypothetical protein F6I01_02795 [Aerococcus sanguinicola]MDK6233235.1 hypothetical protein [Aerococcus sp. UMB10185]MDK6804655.1 hypothetical protein [Aerococcus sp. UMB7834]MDK6856072.1 hypothetical protein [Aerococcus sp. UMB7533]